VITHFNPPETYPYNSTGNAKRYPSYVPLLMARAAQKEEAKIKRIRKEFRDLFGKKISIKYNLRDLYDILLADKEQTHSESWILSGVPSEVTRYLQAAIDKMKTLAFAEDKLYRAEWLAVAPKGVLLEVVKEMQIVEENTYHECIYQDGFFKLRTIPKNFRTHHATIADRAVELLEKGCFD